MPRQDPVHRQNDRPLHHLFGMKSSSACTLWRRRLNILIRASGEPSNECRSTRWMHHAFAERGQHLGLAAGDEKMPAIEPLQGKITVGFTLPGAQGVSGRIVVETAKHP